MCENPSLVGRPVIIGGTPERGVVASATYEARAPDVRAGMPTSCARALCLGTAFIPGNHGLYQCCSRQVMAVLAIVTLVLKQAPIDEAFLDVSRARRRLGSPIRTARLIRVRTRETVGPPASVGIAAIKSVAKIASLYIKPDGLLLIPQTTTIDFLHGLPVGALWGIGGKTAAILDREGADMTRDLANTPFMRLTKLLGVASARHLHNPSWGRDPCFVAPTRVEKSVDMGRTFEEDMRSRADIGGSILAASHDCARRLHAGGIVGWTVGIKTRGTDFHMITRSVSLVALTDMGRDIVQAAQGLSAHEDIPIEGVWLFGVRTEGLQACSGGVAIISDRDERPAASERAMDQICDKFGADALALAMLLGRKVPGRRSFGESSDEAGTFPAGPSTQAHGQESDLGSEEPTQGTFL